MTQRFTMFLDWEKNVQFAGLAWAEVHGLYRGAGLSVDIVPWAEDGRSMVETVMAGRLCAGSAEDNLIVAAAASGAAPVTALAAMFQTTPLVVMSQPGAGIRALRDLVGRRVAMHCDGIRILEALLDLEGIPLNALEIAEVTHDLGNLTSGKWDAVQGYAVAEPLELASRGIAVDCLTLRSPRLHPYAQVIFADRSEVAANFDVFAAFLRATFEGWTACLNDLPGAAAAIKAVGAPMADPTREAEALARVRSLVRGEGAGRLGALDRQRWADNVAAYAAVGIIPNGTPGDCALHSGTLTGAAHPQATSGG